MIQYIHQNNVGINRRKILLFKLFEIGVYKDTNFGTHYCIQLGIGSKQLHFTLRQWDTSNGIGDFYDA